MNPVVATFWSVLQVIPALKDHREERLLAELHKRWNNHLVMTRWLSRFFNYLDRCGWGMIIYACIIAAVSEDEVPLVRKNVLREVYCSCRYYISRHSLDSLNNVGLICFRGGFPWPRA